MARAQFYDVGIDSQGNAVTTTRVSVYARGTTTLSTIYTTEAGATPKSNPFNATTGFIDFWVDPGEYDIQIEDTNSPASFTTRVIGWSSVPHTEGIYYQSLAKYATGPGYAAFAARMNSAAGDGSNFYLSGAGFFRAPYNQEIFDLGNNYNPGPSHHEFTAPVRGIYQFNVQTGIGRVGGFAGTTVLIAAELIIAGINPFVSLAYNAIPATDFMYYSGIDARPTIGRTLIRVLEAGDTCNVQVYAPVVGGTMSFAGAAEPGTEFSGHLIARLS